MATPGKEIIKDSRKAELVASYLYLEQHIHNRSSDDEIVGELMIRKPYLSPSMIQEVMTEWNTAISN